MTGVVLQHWDSTAAGILETWRSLMAEQDFNPSLHPEWLSISLEALGLRSGVQVALISDAAGGLTVIPFHLRRRSIAGVPLRSLEVCSNALSNHAELVHRGELRSMLTQFLADTRLPRWDVFRMDNLPIGGPSYRAALDVANNRGLLTSRRDGLRSPFVTIDKSWPEYLQTRPKKLRANIARSQRLMAEAGESGISAFGADSDVELLLREITQIESLSWKAAAGTAIAAGSVESRYYSSLLPWLVDNGLMADVLYVKGQPVAYALCARWRGWVGQLKTSFSAHLKDAGSRIIQASMQRAFELGAREYDFLGDAAPHKLRWTESIREHADVWLFNDNWQGRALGALKGAIDTWKARQAARSHADGN